MKKVWLGCKYKSIIELCLNICKVYCIYSRCWFANVYAAPDVHTVDWHSVCYCWYIYGSYSIGNDFAANFVIQDLYWLSRVKRKYHNNWGQPCGVSLWYYICWTWYALRLYCTNVKVSRGIYIRVEVSAERA